MAERPPPPPNPPAVADEILSRVASLSDVKDKEFDYVIVGGGTSGLVIAARLTEDPSISVAVLEAGDEVHTLDIVSQPGRYAHALIPDPEGKNEALRYLHLTVPQKGMLDPTPGAPEGQNRPFALFRGRGVGGSTAINFYAWQSPQRFDIDAWERLGSKGWIFDRYHKALKRAENFHMPTEEHIARSKLVINEADHGKGGPIHLSYPGYEPSGGEYLVETWKNLGNKPAKNAYSGELNGIAFLPGTIDPATLTRSFSATGYFVPNAGRPNLKLLTGATARKILFKDGTTDPVVASGIEFSHGGAKHVVSAKRDVILCASSILSAALLERSGIGSRKILEPLGIDVKIENENVGENIQEHLYATSVFELDTSKGNFANFAWGFDPENPTAPNEWTKKHMGHYLDKSAKDWGKVGMLSTSLTYALFLPIQDVSPRAKELVEIAEKRVNADIAAGKVPPYLQEQYKIQIERLKNGALSDTEFFAAPQFGPDPAFGVTPSLDKVYTTFANGLNHPFSRGSIHIRTADPDAPNSSIIDPKVFDHDIDVELLVESIKYLRKTAATAPFKDVLVENPEKRPGPKYQDDESLRRYIREWSDSTWHTIGGCCALPRDQGGVVDPSLRVYGTANLRVGDLSIAPLHTLQHVQPLAYAIGEQLAEIIKSEH